MPEAAPAETVRLHRPAFPGRGRAPIENAHRIGWPAFPRWWRCVRPCGVGANPLCYASYVGVIGLLLLLGGVTAAILRGYYIDQQAQIESRVMAFTNLLEEHTLRNIQAVDLLLQLIIDAAPQKFRTRDPQFEDWLRRSLKNVPYVRSIIVIGADGRYAQGTFDSVSSDMRPVDREYFTSHTDDFNPGLHVSHPVLSRRDNTWMVPLSRRLSNHDGSFAGVVVAALEPVFYEHFYAGVPMSQGQAIALWHADGHLIARAPEDFGLVGQKASWAAVLSEDLKSSTGVLVRQNPFNAAEQRVVAYRRLPNIPLVVTASINLAAAMKQTWQVIDASLVGFVVLCVLALTTSILIFKCVRERERRLVSQKAEALSRMTGGIAHDFNNMLAAIGAAMRIVSINLQDPKTIETCIAAAQQAVERGTELTSQLLMFAKRRSLVVQTADVNELLRKLEPLLRYASIGINLQLELGAGLALCRLDRTQFDAAILNIILNSRDAMPEGGCVTIATSAWTQRSVRMQTLKPGRYVLVRITDTGQGIPREVVSRVFDPFFTTKGEQGTGLGLAQVYGFLSTIGGEVHVASEPGAGTTVELYFPADNP